ncbi:MAG TPA: hypothetical protein VJ912_03470 [Candidatus Nanoarchaeia archaeon]|nr:hypothetical protein [Candidatus Nanoarchaeia archaeon]
MKKDYFQHKNKRHLIINSKGEEVERFRNKANATEYLRKRPNKILEIKTINIQDLSQTNDNKHLNNSK